MTTMKEMEAQIAALQKQVQFLLEAVGKIPLQADTVVYTKLMSQFRGERICLQRLKTDGCTSLKEWLKVHDTSKLFPGHCVQFTEQYEHSLVITEYVYGWEELEHRHHQLHRMHSFRYNQSESMRQWSNQRCDTAWAVLERKDLRTCRTRGQNQ